MEGEKKPAGIVLGTMTMSKQTNEEDSIKMIEYLFQDKFSTKELDTALMYPALDRQVRSRTNKIYFTLKIRHFKRETPRDCWERF